MMLKIHIFLLTQTQGKSPRWQRARERAVSSRSCSVPQNYNCVCLRAARTQDVILHSVCVFLSVCVSEKCTLCARRPRSAFLLQLPKRLRAIVRILLFERGRQLFVAQSQHLFRTSRTMEPVLKAPVCLCE